MPGASASTTAVSATAAGAAAFVARLRFGFSVGSATAVASEATGALGASGASTARSRIVMWAVRLRIRIARPRARGCQRFIVTPSSANASATTRDSSSRPWLLTALAIADSSTRRMSSAAWRVAKRNWTRASATGNPRTCSSTTRALRADVRTHLAWARTSPVSS